MDEEEELVIMDDMPACRVCGAVRGLKLSYQGQAGTMYLCVDEEACVQRRSLRPHVIGS